MPNSILLPIYKWWQLPYYYAGCKMYDLIAGSQNMEGAYMMFKSGVMEAFPMLKTEGLVGGVVYYDGECCPTQMRRSSFFRYSGDSVASASNVSTWHSVSSGPRTDPSRPA